MKIAAQRFRPVSAFTCYARHGEIRVVNRSGRNVPGTELSDLFKIASEVHASLRGDTDQTMAVYTEGKCCLAAEKMAAIGFVKYYRTMTVDLICGREVEGSSGSDKNSENGLHYLALFMLKELEAAVDVTVAQLGGRNNIYQNTEALILLSAPGKIMAPLREAYHGGLWVVIPFGSVLKLPHKPSPLYW